MIHEIYANDLVNSLKTTIRKKKTFDKCDHIISISKSTKNDLINLFGIESSKISVVHLGVDLDLYKNSDKNNHIMNAPYILYVGSRDSYKNFKGFIKACSISNQIKNKVKIVAFGGGRFSNCELEMFKSYGFKNNNIINLFGDDNLLSSLYSNALCFVYPSLYEGFGLPPLEAMAAKCPVVTSNSSSMPEVVNDAGIYFDPNNIEEMAEAIEKVIHDKEVSKNLVKAGLDNIKHFSWNKCSVKTFNVYKKLTGM
jgi:glycosyltransferase involved in cell wall biosynthesis